MPAPRLPHSAVAKLCSKQRKRIQPRTQRKRNALATEAMRFKNRADHLNGCCAVARAAKRLPPFLDGGDEIVTGQYMPGQQAPEGGYRLRPADTGGRDRSPRPRFLHRLKWTAGQQVRKGLLIATEIEDALAAANLEAKSRRWIARAFYRVKKQRDAPFRFKARMDFIACKGADALRPFPDVCAGNGTSVLQHGRRTE